MIRQQHGSVRGTLTHTGAGAGVVVDDARRVLVLADGRHDLAGLVGELVDVEGLVVLVDDVPIEVTTTRIERVAEPELSWRQLRGLMPDFADGLPPSRFLDGVWGQEAS